MFFLRQQIGVWCLGSDLITPCRCSLGDSVSDEKIFPTPLAGACRWMLVMVMGLKKQVLTGQKEGWGMFESEQTAALGG